MWKFDAKGKTPLLAPTRLSSGVVFSKVWEDLFFPAVFLSLNISYQRKFLNFSVTSVPTLLKSRLSFATDSQHVWAAGYNGILYGYPHAKTDVEEEYRINENGEIVMGGVEMIQLDVQSPILHVTVEEELGHKGSSTTNWFWITQRRFYTDILQTGSTATLSLSNSSVMTDRLQSLCIVWHYKSIR